MKAFSVRKLGITAFVCQEHSPLFSGAARSWASFRAACWHQNKWFSRRGNVSRFWYWPNELKEGRIINKIS